MEEKQLTYHDVPSGYPLCFNNECAKNANCMHYQARTLLPEGSHQGPAIYPTAWEDGECPCYREKRLVQRAWGFTHLYDNIPQQDKAKARRSVRCFFSEGCGPYYRYHHGENTLSLKQQQDILNILAKFGSTDGLRFDHYVEAWDFE